MCVASCDEELATALLWDAGTLGIEVRPAGPGEVALLAYFPAAPNLERDLAAAMAPLEATRLEPAAVAEVDWVARFREGFRAFSVGRFRITPPWQLGVEPAPGQTPLVVDPGRAFGTGTHETTRLCLAALEELALERPLGSTLDLGTGTGILAVAASLLCARPVVGVDLDLEAVESARRHARLNRVDVHLVAGDGARPFKAGAFDLVLANISAPLLIERRDEIAGLRAPHGALVLSGLLTDDLGATRGAYGPLGSFAVRTEGEWAAVLVRSRA